jgi:hypothetical protein
MSPVAHLFASRLITAKTTDSHRDCRLCYYLQEKGLLVKFYHEFAANAPRDPTGYNTLKRVLGEDDMQAFKTKWEKFVLSLRSP